MMGQPEHLGTFIREKVLPSNITVTAAAKLLNIGRVALSRVLNGKAALSPELAERIQHAFGFPAEKLLKMQASHDAETPKKRSSSGTVGHYAPPFLQIRTHQIEHWASQTQARYRLAVLLRVLINSTGSGLSKVDFPGNDDAERRGWDGVVEADRETPWIPQGLSGWEFGCNQEIKRKANEDFRKRTRSTPESERMDTTFVFVTPRRWTKKNDWEKERNDERQWKNVRVFDASDLEQWFEQSIPAQIWFASETKIPSKGVFSLEQCWEDWQEDCEPTLVPSLFDQALRESKDCVMRWLGSDPGTPLKIAADSTAEALAYLYVVFSEEEPLFRDNRDKVIVFTESGVLPELLSGQSDLIVVSTSPEIEKELAPHRQYLRTILVYSQNMANVNPDITLKPLSPFALDASLKKMGFNQDDADRYRRECGYSLTVLRRRLSQMPKVRTPEWVDTEHAEKLIPMVFAGAWDSNNEMDNFLVSELTNKMDVEEEILKLKQLEDSPVWLLNSYRGIKSRIDALFAVSESVTTSHIEEFLQVAEIVLSEDDPALDLPEDQQWLANLYGKRREISDLLRAGVISSFVLLAVYGNSLFRDRIGFDIETRVQEIIKKLLSPLTERVLEAQSDALPAYAEAAPDTFLSIIEQDLDENGDSKILGLFRPFEASLFKSPPWVELLWALESLAWSREYLVRTVDILAQLAQKEPDDNYSNKAINSLTTIFWPPAPQTSVTINELIVVLNHIMEKFPNIGWIMCMKQLELSSGISASYKPKWRTDGHGHGRPVLEDDFRKFVRNAARKAIDWSPHTKETLANLVQSLGSATKIPYEWWPEIWELVENWRNEQGTSDSDRAWLREAIRVSVDFKAFPEAKSAYNMLEPTDCVLKYEWLFCNYAVPYSRTELLDPDFDIQQYGEKIELRRIFALSEIYSEDGLSGLIRLAGGGEGQYVIGNLVSRVDSFSGDEAKSLILNALDKMTAQNRTQMENLIRVLFMGLEPACRDSILRELLVEKSSEETFPDILLLAPFESGTWELIKGLDREKQLEYWRKIEIRQATGNPVELNEALERLIEAGCPIKAASLVQYQIHKIETGRIFRLLISIAEKKDKHEEGRGFDPMLIEKAFGQLDERAEIPPHKIADLEIDFLDFLEYSKRGIPCLEDRIIKHPQLFAEIVSMAYGHDSAEEDAENSSISEDMIRVRAQKAYKIFACLKQLPGKDESSETKSESLVKWIRKVQSECTGFGRLERGDYRIGELLSRSPDGMDGIWPCEPVRDALEKVYSEDIRRGFRTGRINSRGARTGFDGGPEREVERKYLESAERLKYSHPKTSKILQELADYYSALANHQDTEAEKLFRQMSF